MNVFFYNDSDNVCGHTRSNVEDVTVLQTPTRNYEENFEAAEQLFQDEYGCRPALHYVPGEPMRDGGSISGDLFEIVAVPDDVANISPSKDGSEVIILGEEGTELFEHLRAKYNGQKLY